MSAQGIVLVLSGRNLDFGGLGDERAMQAVACLVDSRER